MRFAWDHRKATANETKHAITFEEAVTAFDDPYALVAPDPRHSSPVEERRWLIGEADAGVLVVVFTLRERGDVYRIISARPANRKERIVYEQSKRVPL